MGLFWVLDLNPANSKRPRIEEKTKVERVSVELAQMSRPRWDLLLASAPQTMQVQKNHCTWIARLVCYPPLTNRFLEADGPDLGENEKLTQME